MADPIGFKLDGLSYPPNLYPSIHHPMPQYGVSVAPMLANYPNHLNEIIPPAYYWVKTNNRSNFPSTALEAGVDSDGTKIYVGRAFHEGDWIPAKVIPEKNISYVAYGGQEHGKEEFEVLCEQRFDWLPSSGGSLPYGAVEGGRTSDGETLYIGRVWHEGSHTVGKVQLSHGVCYIPYGGEEVAYPNYEILILRA